MAEDIKKNKGEKPQRNNRKERPVKENDGLEKRLVSVRRVSKTVKGGRTMHFSALVVIGDMKGNIGMGIGKASEVPNAIDKATVVAKKNMKKISLSENTIPHETIGKFGATSVLMIPAEEVTELLLVVLLVQFWKLQALRTSSQKFMVQQTELTWLRQP